MATERNPFDRIEKELTNVVPMNPVAMGEEQEATFEGMVCQSCRETG